MLTLLFEVTDLFDMETRPELLLLQKTMVVVEGVARTLNPSFNMWKTAEPVVGDWIRRNLGPVGMLEDAKDTLGAAQRLIHMLPDIADKAEALSDELENMAVNGMKLSAETTDAIGKAEARNNRWGHLGIWALVALFAWWLFV